MGKAKGARDSRSRKGKKEQCGLEDCVERYGYKSQSQEVRATAWSVNLGAMILIIEFAPLFEDEPSAINRTDRGPLQRQKKMHVDLSSAGYVR
jgi:hypothetical protein